MFSRSMTPLDTLRDTAVNFDMPQYVERIRGIVKLDKLYIPNVLYVGKWENSGVSIGEMWSCSAFFARGMGSHSQKP